MAKKITERRITVKETAGNLPYVVMWISKNGLPYIKEFSTIGRAQSQHLHLTTLGCRASLLINFDCCTLKEPLTL